MSTISLRFDTETKNEIDKLCDKLGLSVTNFFTIFAKKVGRERRIPFEITADSDRNTQYLEGIMQDIKSGKAHFAEHELLEEK